MSKIRLFKGLLENKAVQNVIVKKGLKVAIAGLLMSSISATFIGCGATKSENKEVNSKPAIEEKADEQKEDTSKEDKKDESKVEDSVSENKNTESKIASNDTKPSILVQANIGTGKGDYIVENNSETTILPVTENQSQGETSIQGTVTPVKDEKEESTPQGTVEENPTPEVPVETPKPEPPVVEDPKPEESVVEEPTTYTEEGYLTQLTKEHEDEVLVDLYKLALADGYFAETTEAKSDDEFVELTRLTVPAHELNGSRFEWEKLKAGINPEIKTIKFVIETEDGEVEEVSNFRSLTNILNSFAYAPKEKQVEFDIVVLTHEIRYDLNNDGYEDNKYLTKEGLPSSHYDLVIERFTKALTAKGFTEAMGFSDRDYYLETVKVPLHAYNGLKDFEINTLVDILTKTKSTKFKVYANSRGDIEKDHMWIMLYFDGNNEDANNDGYKDSLLLDSYTDYMLSNLDFYYNLALEKRVGELAEPYEGATSLGTIAFPMSYENNSNFENDKLADFYRTLDADNIFYTLTGNNDTHQLVFEFFGTPRTEEVTPDPVEGEVTPVENTAPVLECLDKIEIVTGTEITAELLQVHVTDNESDEVTVNIDTKGHNFNEPGSYGITVTATDSKGASTSKDVIVNVKGDTSTEYTQDTEYANALNQEILRLVNIEREKAGVPALDWLDAIEPYATAKSLDMIKNNYFDHIDKQGRYTYNDMLDNGFMFLGWGENIITGHKSDVASTAKNLVDRWMASTGHRENILNADFNKTGVGVFVIGDKVYGTQIFITQ